MGCELNASMVSFAVEDPIADDARWCFDQYFAGGWRRRRVLRRIWVAHRLGFVFAKGADLESTHRNVNRW